MIKGLFRNRYSLIWMMVLFSLLLSLLTRIVLLAGAHNSGVSFLQALGAFGIGLSYDLTISFFIVTPFVLQIWLQNDLIYRKNIMPYVCLFFAGLLFVLLFTRLVPRDFSPELYKGLIVYVILRFLIYLCLFLLPYKYRIRWRKAVLYAASLLVVFLLLLNAVSEWFFWQEFSTRYNFIAVDYLVYTTEVLGNISESYPLGMILTTLVLLSVLIVFLMRNGIRNSATIPLSFFRRSLLALLILALPWCLSVIVQEKWRHFSQNEYANSLAGNGIFEFAVAFQQNELDFYKFYKTIPDQTAFQLLRQQLDIPGVHFTGNDPFSIERDINYQEPARKLNVVLISVESLSADFMKFFGNKNNITPYLDSLAKQSLFFTNFYSSGTRTVRGLEALSLSIPPTPGQSIVKRPDNHSLFSLGSVFRSKGYITQYLYGGYSYFDNMKEFFGGNGYQVIDRSSIPTNEVHYANIWGVADEDLFSLALHVLDSNYNTGKPFFSHIMTVSNHRPYTYPEGRIDIPPTRQERAGAVKYTDYAINSFLKQAQGKKWFDSTIFVIVADHCAGSAGSVELPVTGYHIPMLIYAPGIVPARQFDELTAQIDVAPTILGLLRFNYRSRFFGLDALNTPADKRRAFISTYQGLGYLKNGRLLVQSPVRTIHEYIPDINTGNAVQVSVNDSLAREAIAWYQGISWLLKNKKQME